MYTKRDVEELLNGEIRSILQLDMRVAAHRSLQNRYKNHDDNEIIIRSLKYRYQLSSVGFLIEWFRNPLEIKVYPILVQSPYREAYTAYSLRPHGEILQDYPGHHLRTRQEVLDFMDDLGYEEVQFLFQD